MSPVGFWFGVQLVENFFSEPEAVHGRRYAAVDGDLEKHFLDLVLGEAVVQRALDMHLDLMRAVERADHRQVQHAASLAVKPGTSPDSRPSNIA